MLNPQYYIRQIRELLDEYDPSRERSLAVTKLDELEMWLARCTPSQEAVERDMMAVAPLENPVVVPTEEDLEWARQDRLKVLREHEAAEAARAEQNRTSDDPMVRKTQAHVDDLNNDEKAAARDGRVNG